MERRHSGGKALESKVKLTTVRGDSAKGRAGHTAASRPGLRICKLFPLGPDFFFTSQVVECVLSF